MKPQLERLTSTLQQLAECESKRDRRLLVRLARELASQVDTSVPILLPDGRPSNRSGYRLEMGDGDVAYVVADGWLWWPTGAPTGDEPISPADPAVDVRTVATALRWLALRVYEGGVPLAQRTGLEALTTLSELFSVVWEVDRHSRQMILEAIVAAMHQAVDWDRCWLRLKTGFERAVFDPMPAIRATAARGLATVATRPGALPDRDAARSLELLLTSPHEDVRRLTLALLAAQRGEPLVRFRRALAPVLRTCLLDADPEVRRLAAQVVVLAAGGDEAAVLGELFTTGAAEQRAAALGSLVGSADDSLLVLLPYVLDAAGDPSPLVREAALRVLQPLLNAQDSPLRERVLVTLLESGDVELIRVALGRLEEQPLDAQPVIAALQRAVDGPQATRGEVVRLLSRIILGALPEQALEVHLGLLRHADPGVRMATLEALGSSQRLPHWLRDELEQPLLERLHDPMSVLRLEAARTMLRLGYPNAVATAMTLAADEDATVRRGLAAMLREVGASEMARLAEQRAEQAAILLAGGAGQDSDSRIRWLAALDAVATSPSPGTLELLTAVLKSLPVDSGDEFHAFAAREVRERIRALCAEPLQLLEVCRRLLAVPPAAEHAAALAGEVAAREPLVLDFLWTLFTYGQGRAVEAARRELAAVAAQPKTPAVRAWLAEAVEREPMAARRDVLRSLLAGQIDGR